MHLKNINLGIQMILYVHVANFVNVKQIKSVVSEIQRFQEKKTATYVTIGHQMRLKNNNVYLLV